MKVKSRFLGITLMLFYQFTNAQTSTDNLPKIGMGLSAINYYMFYHPFSDAVKTMRWIDVASWDANGFPTAAQTSSGVRGRAGFATNPNYPNGEYVLTWEGDGNVILDLATFILVEEDLSGTTKRRVYNVDTSGRIGVRILSFPATNIKLWIPDEENNQSLWSPKYLCYMKAFKNGVFRFMDANRTNSSQQQYWADRTPINWSTYTNLNANSSTSYNVNGSLPYEAMMAFSNEMNSDIWLNIPHMATDTYITNLAHLIKTGIDLVSGEQVTQPLKSNLKVWIEYSNEVWNFAPDFAQSGWVLNNTDIEGENLDVKYVNKSKSVFELFRNQFADNNRVIRVIASQTGGGGRTYNRMNALTEADFDVFAITTYFRYDYETYIYNNWNGGALTQEQFYNHISNQMGTGAFQTSETANIHIGTAYAYERAALLNKPVVSYEGNGHFNMNRRVDTDDNGTTDTPLYQAIPETLTWMHDFARSEYMVTLLEQYQQRHEISGLQTHVPFVAVNPWSIYGQFSYAEYLGQPISEAPKYKWLHDHYNLIYPDENLNCPTPSHVFTQAVSSDWSNPINWNVNTVPTNSSIVLIPANMIADLNTNQIVINELEIEKSANLTIPSDKELTISSDITSKGNLTINSDATNSGTLIVQGNSQGTVNYNRGGLLANQWSLVSSPVNNQSIQDFILNQDNDIRINEDRFAVASYNDANTIDKWEYFRNPVDSSLVFNIAQGYSMSRNTNGNLTFSGALQVADFQKEVPENQWNLIGNPYTAFYPANYNSNNNFISNNFNQLNEQNIAIYTWDKAQNKYTAISLIDDTATFLTPAQSFFIRTKTSVNLVDFMASNRLTQPLNGKTTFQRNNNPTIKLFSTSNEITVNTDIKFFDNTNDGFDVGYDIQNFDNNTFDLYTHLVDNSNQLNYTIQSISDTQYLEKTFPLGINSEEENQITITATITGFSSDVNIYLEDRVLNMYTNLNNVNPYTFNSNEGLQGVGRFYVYITNQTLKVNDINDKNSNIFTINKNLIISNLKENKTVLKLYNVQGKELLKTTLFGQKEQKISLSKLSAGVYIAILDSGTKKQIKKVVLQ
jgi:hypothetical protein